MSAKTRLLRRAAIVLVIAVPVSSAACGRGEPGPTAHPDTVVRQAPDITASTKTARVVTGAPGFTGTGSVEFATGIADVVIEPQPKSEPPFGVTQPVAVLDLLRGVVDVRAYGGAEVQGAGTKRYEVDISLPKAISATPPERQAPLHALDGKLGTDNRVWADVFVDARGRVRRVLLPVRTAMVRPFGQDQHIPQLVSVDYSDFGTRRAT